MSDPQSEKETLIFNQVFIDQMADAAYWISPDGQFEYVNNAACSLLGYNREELNWLTIRDIASPGNGLLDWNEHWQMLKISGTIFSESNFKNKTGLLIPVSLQEKYVKSGDRECNCCLVRDITEVKNAEATIRIKEEKFYKAFNSGQIAMAISTLDEGVFINANQQFYELLGYEESEVIGKSSKDLNLFADWNQRNEAHALLAKTGHLYNFEALARTKTGDVLTCLFSVDQITIQNQKHLLTSANNITSLKEAESKIKYLFEQQKLLADISQLLNSNSQLDLIMDDILKHIGIHLDVSRVYIFENSNDGTEISNTYEWCNKGIAPRKKFLQGIGISRTPAWEKLLITEGGIFSEDLTDLPTDLYKILNPLQVKSILIYPIYVQNSFCGFIGFDENRIDKIWREDELDLLSIVSLTISNAFERHQVKQKLENSELRLSLAIESGNEGIWDWNNETGFVFFSETWCRMLGYEPDVIAPNESSWDALLHPEDKPVVREILGKHLKGETEYYESIHRMKAKSGEWKWILDHGRVVERNNWNQPVRTVGTHIDVTRQKEIEQELQEVVRTKNRLFSIISHDLRGPIGSFFPILDLLTNDPMMEDNIRTTLIENLKNTSRVTYTMLDNLLIWAKSQMDDFSLKASSFSINELIKGNIELFSPLANQKRINISYSTEKEIFAFADRDTIDIVIRNLLSNSIKFTHQGGSLEISSRESAGNVEVTVKDNGVGMAPEFVETLLKTSSFVSLAGTNHERGSGLGFNLCKDFVHRNGGEIRVESTLGTGSKFLFTLPGN